MTDLDAEALGFAVLQDCKTLGNATPQQLASSLMGGMFAIALITP